MSTEVLGSLPESMAKVLSGIANLGVLSSPLVVTGKSGVRHTFTFGVGSTESPKVACDVVLGTAPVDETKVLSLFIKVYDVGAKNSILCVAPSLTPDAKKLSNLYKILVVEAQAESEILSRLSELLQRMATT